jgi:hypothetical protein
MYTHEIGNIEAEPFGAAATAPTLTLSFASSG